MKVEFFNVFHHHIIDGKQYYYLVSAELGERINRGEGIRLITGSHANAEIKDYRQVKNDISLCAQGFPLTEMLNNRKAHNIETLLEEYRHAISENQTIQSLIVKDGGFVMERVTDQKIINLVTERDNFLMPKDKPSDQKFSLENIDMYYEKIRQKVLGQDNQIKRIIGAIYSWQKTINIPRISLDIIRQAKPNIMIIGASGTGKTEIVKQFVGMINVPYVIEDASRYTSEGFVGQSVDDMLLDLIIRCNGDVRAAERGIIVIDEIDKLNVHTSREDGFGDSVQKALVTMMEGGKYTVSRAKNILSQSYTIDTTRIQFILMGSFSDQMVADKAVGFGSAENLYKSYKKLTSNDLIAMGMKPELVGRAPAIVGLNNLTVEDYKRIILESKISYVNIIKELLALNGVKLNVTDGFINELAKRVAVSKIGARSIREIIIGLIGELEYEIHLGDIKEITLDESLFYQNVFSKTV